MIARISTPAGKKRFRRACRGVPCLETLLPMEQALFGRSQPGRFYAGPSLAMDIGGPDVLAAGGANPEELASFLGFCGCRSLITDGPPPAGWSPAEPVYCFALAAGNRLPLPPAEESLWARLRLDTEPPAGALAQFLYPDQTQQREDYYSALCTKRNRGLARVWALMDGETIAATVGAYAIWGGKAYLACGCAAESLRGRGVGGRLIASLANTLAAEGLDVSLMCRPERVRFYQRLGMEQIGVLTRCQPNQIGKEN